MSTRHRPILTLASLLAALLLALVGVSACSSDDADGGDGPGGAGSDEATKGELFPDVTDVEVSGEGDSLSFDVTMTSPYDSPDRYADGIRVRSADGEVYGSTTLGHDHAAEQPFTRSVTDVSIPDGVDEVVVEGHDQVSGWGGETVTVDLP